MTKPRTTPKARGRAIFILMGTGTLAFAVAACGSSPQSVAHIGSTSSTTTAAAAAAPTASGPSPADIGSKIEKFVSCMRSHGVADFPSPIIGGGKVGLVITPAIAQNPKFATAQAACRYLLPARLQGPSITPADQQDYLKGAACMRAHGIPNFPDPVFGGQQGVDFPIPTGMNTSSQQFVAARQICEKLIPAGLPYSN